MIMTMTLTPRLQEIADKVVALQRLKQTGFQTNKTIRALLDPLTPNELVQVAQVYAKAIPPTEVK